MGLLGAMSASLCCAQGTLSFFGSTIAFDNLSKIAEIDARVSYLDGTPLGAGFTAQLYGAPVGTPTDLLQPLFPTTRFVTDPPEGLGYIFPRIVETQWSPDTKLTVVMRAFDGGTWEQSTCRGESMAISLRPASPLGLPTSLAGLQPFSVNCVPEPSVAGLVAGGGLILLFCCPRRGSRTTGVARWRNEKAGEEMLSRHYCPPAQGLKR